MMSNLFSDIWMPFVKTTAIKVESFDKVFREIFSSEQPPAAQPQTPKKSEKRKVTVEAIFPKAPKKIGSVPTSSEAVQRFSSPLNVDLLSGDATRKFSKIGCLVILQNVIDELEILSKFCQSFVCDVRRRDVLYRPIFERYAFEKSSWGDFVIEEEYTDIHKFLKEVKTLLYVLNEVGHEVTIFNGVSGLELYVESENKKQRDEVMFFEQVERLEQVYQELNKAHKNFRIEHTRRCREMDALARETVTDMKDEYEFARAEWSYTQKWENSRREQNRLFLQKSEDIHRNVVDIMTYNIAQEDICHESLEKYLTERKQDLSDEIERFMEIYDKESDEKDIEMYTLRKNIDKVKDDKEICQIKYNSRIKEMEEYKEYKRKKKEEETRRELEFWAANVIQAWWRGVMFRKKIGPYKKKKKKGKGKEKKAGKAAKGRK